MILRLDEDVMDIAFRSLSISGSATIIGGLVFVPVGGLIYFYSFRLKNVLIGIINTSSHPPDQTQAADYSSTTRYTQASKSNIHYIFIKP
jgi:hypothetical protein